MVKLSKSDFGSSGTGTLQPLRVKKEWLWHSHEDINNIYEDPLAKSHIMVKYEICIYSDRTSTVEVVEEMSNEEWFKRKLAGTLQGHWSFEPELDK